MEYRRAFQPGGTFFFTLVTYNRSPILADAKAVDLLRQAVRYTMSNHPFSINAAVIMPDHLHMIWTLPEDSQDYPTRWRLIKSFFSRNFDGALSEIRSESRRKKGERLIWQRRYWEHLIRDDMDLQRHVEYIHFNPVKHGLATSPVDWKYSSIHSYIQAGLYAADWGSEIPKMDQFVVGEPL